MHDNTNHSTYTLTNGSLIQPFSLLKLRLTSETFEHSHKTHICTQGKHMSHNHIVFLDDYMNARLRLRPMPLGPEALRFPNFLLKSRGEMGRVSPKN